MARDFLDLLSRLHDHRAEFVIVGGVAAAMHGGTRVTFDLDIVTSLDPQAWQATVDLLWSLGARPRIPEPLERVRAVTNVQQWRRDKGMLALNFRASRVSTEPARSASVSWCAFNPRGAWRQDRPASHGVRE